MIEVSLQKMAQIHNLSRPSCVPPGSFTGILLNTFSRPFRLVLKMWRYLHLHDVYSCVSGLKY